VIAYLLSAKKLVAYLLVNHVQGYIAIFRWTFTESFEHVKHGRSVIAPNPSFMQQLRNYEQHCKDDTS
jgi:hypothetical protein